MSAPNQHTISVGFFLVPGFSLVALSCAIDVLRAANLEALKTNFEWHLLGEQEAAIASSSGITLEVTAIDMEEEREIIAVCGGDRTHLYRNDRVENWLRQQARLGRTIGSISDGAFLVARTGLFDQCRSTIHWKCQTAYREIHPKLDVRASILEIDGKRFSCAGGTASLDLMLRLLTNEIGAAAAGRIADNYVHDVIRGEEQMQSAADAFRYAELDSTLSQALFLMASNLETPLPLSKIVSAAGTTARQLDRLFRRHLNSSPSTYYRGLRLNRASGLLKQSGLSVGEIAIACGFQSASHLSRHFSTKYGQTPGRYRSDQ